MLEFIILVFSLAQGSADDINDLADQNTCKKWDIVSALKCNTDKSIIGNCS